MTNSLQINRKNNSKVTNYLTKERGLDESLLDFYEVGYSTNPVSSLYKRILLPVKNPYGDVLGYQARTTPWDNLHPKYLMSNGLDKSWVLYGMYENIIDESIFKHNYVILVEGNFHVIALKQLGFPAVCTMGTGISNYQLFQLGCFVKNVIVVPDNDVYGLKDGKKVADALRKWEFNVRPVKLPTAINDPNDVLMPKFESYRNRVVNLLKNESSYF